MSGSRFFLRCVFALALLLCGMNTSGQEVAAQFGSLIRQADHAKTSDNERFTTILEELKSKRSQLSSVQKEWLAFLKTWQVAYLGNLDSAIPKLGRLADTATDPVVEFRARSSLVVLLINVSRYQEAYAGLNKIIHQLPSITNPYDRSQGLIAVGVVLADGGQFSLALDYAIKAFDATNRNAVKCYASYIKYLVYYRQSALETKPSEINTAIRPCVADHDILIANSIRAFFIEKWLEQGDLHLALEELNRHHDEVTGTRYWELISQFDALLATAYLKAGEPEKAQSFALRVVGPRSNNQHTQFVRDAYKVLVEVASHRGQWQKAVGLQKKYMAADKGYLNEVSAKALAYQKVAQQVQASRSKAKTAERQNRILRLQRSLGQKSAETSRLYILLLFIMVVLLALVVWLLARSRHQFRRMARRDSLTGICSRQHFLDQTQRCLDYCARAGQPASLILVDLDHFKRINDEHGHATGDAVLQRTVVACGAKMRAVDVFGRLGGEEFGILLPECDLDCARPSAERIREAVAAMRLREFDMDMVVTASLGVADTRHSGYRLSVLLGDADKALYRAKRKGRNRVAV